VVEEIGAWYIYNGDRLGQGKDNLREFLRENPAMSAEIEQKIREKAGVSSRSRKRRRPLRTTTSRKAATPQAW